MIVASVDVQPRFEAEYRTPVDRHQEFSFPTVFPAQSSWYVDYGKRAKDIILALLGMVVLAPVFIVLAILVRLNLGSGGVIYRQRRIGRDGRPFHIYKFRSMLPDRRKHAQPYVGRERRVNHKSDDDPRHTRFGRFIRAHSLDELPQLLNVLKGDMSLVGPRPELVEVAERNGFARHPRHRERPGITGTFQVSELRSTNRIAAGLHLDVAYVADVKLRRDLAILAKTVGVIVGRSN